MLRIIVQPQCRLLRIAQCNIVNYSTKTVTSFKANDEYLPEAIYPEILDTTTKAKRVKERYSWYEKIQNLKTIEEKQLEINMPRYYGYQSIMLNDERFPYNCLPFTKFATKTYFQELDSISSLLSGVSKPVDDLLNSTKSNIEDVIQFELDQHKRKPINDRDEHISPEDTKRKIMTNLINQIHRTVTNSVSADIYHLKEAEIDLEPRIEAFWFCGGIVPPRRVIKYRKSLDHFKGKEMDPVNRSFQYYGRPYLTLRHKNPLLPVTGSLALDTAEVEKNIEKVPYDPRTFGYHHDYKHGTNIPGFWPGSENEFGLLSYQTREFINSRNPSFGEEDMKATIHSHGILSSFAWLVGQANYQGFTTFNEITYPLVTQTIVTDGQIWSFYLYQMNTMLTHNDNIHDYSIYNQCWGTKELKLFDSIDDNGKLVGYNPDVLKELLHFYLNKPEQRANLVLKPYLGLTEKTVSEIGDTERRNFLENTYKHMVSNRPRHRSLPEIYNWEKIYKIDNKTRSLEPKRRFFELGINPWNRRLDEHKPEYIPKAVRPDGPKGKKRWQKMYYP